MKPKLITSRTPTQNGKKYISDFICEVEVSRYRRLLVLVPNPNAIIQDLRATK